MIKIGEKCETIKKMQSEVQKYEKQVAKLNSQIEKTKKSISKLEESKLPIRFLLAIEDHHYGRCFSSSDIYYNQIYYFPDTDSTHSVDRFLRDKERIFSKEIDVSKFYKSGCDTYETKLPLGEHFMSGKKYQTIIQSAVDDIKGRIGRILEKNTDLDDWDVLGKLLVASYYNL